MTFGPNSPERNKTSKNNRGSDGKTTVRKLQDGFNFRVVRKTGYFPNNQTRNNRTRCYLVSDFPLNYWLHLSFSTARVNHSSFGIFVIQKNKYVWNIDFLHKIGEEKNAARTGMTRGPRWPFGSLLRFLFDVGCRRLGYFVVGIKSIMTVRMWHRIHGPQNYHSVPFILSHL